VDYDPVNDHIIVCGRSGNGGNLVAWNISCDATSGALSVNLEYNVNSGNWVFYDMAYDHTNNHVCLVGYGAGSYPYSGNATFMYTFNYNSAGDTVTKLYGWQSYWGTWSPTSEFGNSSSIDGRFKLMHLGSEAKPTSYAQGDASASASDGPSMVAVYEKDGSPYNIMYAFFNTNRGSGSANQNSFIARSWDTGINGGGSVNWTHHQLVLDPVTKKIIVFGRHANDRPWYWTLQYRCKGSGADHWSHSSANVANNGVHVSDTSITYIGSSSNDIVGYPSPAVDTNTNRVVVVHTTHYSNNSVHGASKLVAYLLTTSGSFNNTSDTTSYSIDSGTIVGKDTDGDDFKVSTSNDGQDLRFNPSTGANRFMLTAKRDGGSYTAGTSWGQENRYHNIDFGQKYYVSSTGTLTTTATDRFIGTAISATEIILSDGDLDGYSIGTGANNIIALDAQAKIPAVDGSQLTGLASGPVLIGEHVLANNSTTTLQVDTPGWTSDYDHLAIMAGFSLYSGVSTTSAVLRLSGYTASNYKYRHRYDSISLSQSSGNAGWPIAVGNSLSNQTYCSYMAFVQWWPDFNTDQNKSQATYGWGVGHSFQSKCQGSNFNHYQHFEGGIRHDQLTSPATNVQIYTGNSSHYWSTGSYLKVFGCKGPMPM
jgi:hypothetical protein